MLLEANAVTLYLLEKLHLKVRYNRSEVHLYAIFLFC